MLGYENGTVFKALHKPFYGGAYSKSREKPEAAAPGFCLSVYAVVNING